MGKTHRYHGRENGNDAKFHRWWRKVEGRVFRKDNDRIRTAQYASATENEEGIRLKNRNLRVPRRPKTHGYGFTPHPFPLDQYADGCLITVGEPR